MLGNGSESRRTPSTRRSSARRRRRGNALESLARATHFVFDKTGTLTTGIMRLVGVIPLGSGTREECLALAAALDMNLSRKVILSDTGNFPTDLYMAEGLIETLGLDDLHYVFLHELAHLKRRDIYLAWLVCLLQVLHWFSFTCHLSGFRSLQRQKRR